jgi:hypothetical protein
MSIAERTLPARRPRFEPSKPDYVVRTEDPNQKGRWLTLGGAWKGETRDGMEVITVKLNTVPVGGSWDGKLKLLPPLDNEAADESAGNVPEEQESFSIPGPRSRRRKQDEEAPAG